MLPLSGTRRVAVVLACAALAGAATGPASASGLAADRGPAGLAAGRPTDDRDASPRAVTTSPRSVPAYIAGTTASARVQGGSGLTDTMLTVATPGQVVWGDWAGRDVETPAVFDDGTWRVYGYAFGLARRLHPIFTVRYGAAGDRPVTGDWDGDGRTDIGVVRGRRWHLAIPTHRSGTAGARSWRSFTFGTGRGQPVAGDWAGRGPDGVGTYQDGVWRLRMSTRAGVRTVERRFAGASGHRTGDVAVVGDWKGEGRDGLGIVRGDAWRLLSDAVDRQGLSTVRVRRPAPGAVPVPWRTGAGPGGGLCPTAPWTLRLDAPGIAAPTGLGTTATPPLPSGPGAGKVLTAMRRSERFLLTTHYRENWKAIRPQPYPDIRSHDNGEELAYRGPAMSALTVAIAVASGVHDEERIGLSRDSALSYITWLVGAIACQHRSVTPLGWGHGWQTAHWAGLAAEAAWLVWDELPFPTRVYVARMVRSEADYQLTRPAEYWKDPSGQVVPGREGNTAAEESAWNAALLELAVAMLPDGDATADYRAQAVQLQASAYATPSDLTSDEVVNGVAMKDRLLGTNALDNGLVVNHHRVHPDYMGNIQMLWWSFDFAALGGGTVTEAARTHADLVYGAFSTLNFVAGADSDAGEGKTYAPPGGTIYRPDAVDPNDMYFPDGSDWGATRRAPFVSIDAHAVELGLAPSDAWPAAEALSAHAGGQLALGAGYDDGRTYSPDPAVAETQDTYGAREEYAASQVATAWLALVLRGAAPSPEVDAGEYPVPAVSNRLRPTAPKPPEPLSP